MARNRSGNGKDDKGAGDVPAARYDEELLSANWNPVVALLEWSCAKTLVETRKASQELREEEADAFLGRIYTSGT